MRVVEVGVRSGTRAPAPTMVARDPAGGWDGVISSKSISTSIDAGIGAGIGTVVVIGSFVGIDAGSASLNRAAAARIRSCGLCRTGVV